MRSLLTQASRRVSSFIRPYWPIVGHPGWAGAPLDALPMRQDKYLNRQPAALFPQSEVGAARLPSLARRVDCRQFLARSLWSKKR